ncbi:MAG: stalk domain-containing protein [Vulcanibacillus sp.]
MKIKILLLISISLLISIVYLPVSIEADNTIYYYSPYPQGTIGVNQPEIGWTIFLGTNKVESAVFTLNGDFLDVLYDDQRQTFYGKPINTLAGENNVTAIIKLEGWGNVIEKTWSFEVDSLSINSLAYPNEQQLNALNLANDYRYILGLNLFQFNNSLNMAAQKHADYQVNLDIFSHYQTEGSIGFFGKTVADRANYYGYFGNMYEDISYQNDPSAQVAIDNLFDAPYHRIPFLIFENQFYGYGMNRYYHVLNFGNDGESISNWIAYPGPDQENIPVAWEDFETPDPLRFYESTTEKVGYPIVVGVYGKNISGVMLKSADLWDDENTEIPCYLNSPKATGGNDEYLDNEVFIIPKLPLELSKKYEVRVELEVTEDGVQQIYDNTWYFTTEAEEGKSKELIHNYFSYPLLQEDSETIIFRLGQRFMWIDDKEYSLDVVPFIENNRTMVPIRALGNSLGAYVDWDNTTGTVIYKKDNLLIKLPIGTNYVTVNGEDILLDQGAVLYEGRSYVPIRFVSEQLGASVDWRPTEREVVIINN